MKSFMEKPENPAELYGEEVANQLQEELERKFKEMKKEDRFPYHGEWLTLEEIQQRQALARKLDRALIVDLTLFYLSLGFGLYILYWVLVKFLLPGA